MKQGWAIRVANELKTGPRWRQLAAATQRAERAHAAGVLPPPPLRSGAGNVVVFDVSFGGANAKAHLCDALKSVDLLVRLFMRCYASVLLVRP